MLKNVLTRLTESKEGQQTVDQSRRGQARTATPQQADVESAVESEVSDEAETDEGPAIELDQVFELLRNRRRRDVLWYLLETDEQMSLSDVAESIAARECDKPVSQITSQERKRVYIGLYQGHLPKMDDYGAIDYDQQRGTIERGPNFSVFVDYLPDDEDVLGPDEDSRSLRETLRHLLT